MSGSQKLDELLNYVREDRLRISNSGKRGILIASESDKGRVINSAPFRRLQQKAQVFPLESNAAVRSRLTHSVEVSQIGRHIAQKIIEKFSCNSESYERLAAFVNAVETACLLHDIGNPPFGHLGEAAVREWFKGKGYAAEDLDSFDGNPQGFRIISFLAGLDDFGFNLTCTQLLSTVKYPWDLKGKPNDKEKIGLFSSDRLSYENACEILGWPKGKRFPLVLLMDVSDEIAYSISDLEDGLEKEIVSEGELRAEFGGELFNGRGLKPIVAFKTNVINKAVECAAEAFKLNFDAILKGENVELIAKDSEIGDLLRRIKIYVRGHIYSNRAAEQIELAGRSVVKGLLDHFDGLLKLPEEDFLALVRGDGKLIKDKGLDFHVRLFRRLASSYRDKYQVASRGVEPLRRAHLVVDFISGMTDDFALETYQILSGIKVK